MESEVCVKLTPLRPNRSASFPLITAPNIAPIVMIEPKSEYCKRQNHEVNTARIICDMICGKCKMDTSAKVRPRSSMIPVCAGDEKPIYIVEFKKSQLFNTSNENYMHIF